MAPGVVLARPGVDMGCYRSRSLLRPTRRCRIDFIWVFEDLENSVIRVIRVDVYLHVGVYG